MAKLVIIDGNAIMHRAYHALPPLTNRRGEPINAIYGLVSMLLRIIQDLKPTQIAVAFDETKPTFRHNELPSYQAQRPPVHKDLTSQFEKARDFLRAAKIPVYSKAGYEADDVIGTIAKKAKKNVVIVTGDRDQLQLVSDKNNIKLYMPVAGLSNAKIYGEAGTTERMGVPPNQIVDLKALTGDPSDNYFGVAGIGPKTATDLLGKYKSVKGIYSHIKDIPERVSQKLINGKKSAEQSQYLATIVTNVPIKFDFKKMSEWKLNSPDVLKVFSNFGFKTLTERIKKVGKQIDLDKQTSLF